MVSGWYHLLATACLAYTATLSSATLSYANSIMDFQGHFLDLSDGRSDRFTPVQSLRAANTTNQQWVIINSDDDRHVYDIANAGSFGVSLTHSTALLDIPGPAIHAQIVGGYGKTQWWHLASTGQLIDADSGLAVTAWPATHGYPSSPLTLEISDPKNKRQIFKLICLYSWNYQVPVSSVIGKAVKSVSVS
ncbi:hypothetical protein C8R43DRAFT_1028216 [Mycena crocata]|nr:hypothetical protein C8R43DRAFT_1028216 [Mycena crocata]